MWNVIKAQNYQNRRYIGTYIAIIISIVMLLFPILDAGGINEITGGYYFVLMQSTMGMSLVLFSLIIVSATCGRDMDDKTINYEVMSGHSRSQIYFGRIITGFVWAIVGGIIIILTPVLIITAINGFGNNMFIRDVVNLYFLNITVYIRWISELALLTFLIKKSHVAAFLAYMIYGSTMIFGMLINSVLDKEMYYIFSSMNFSILSELSNSRNMVINGEAVEVFSMPISPDMQTTTVAVSLAVAVICIIIGYVVFRKRDMR